ncbi:hypothetical protein M9H77_01365 [Catharanthus roseus]|uniref:Uncharacterized protein n=1 Tax=Catharanthus roseus TaxID=4058 RepID=A0ACC0C5A7_CATRO|nr:hypothetical protein M9H77_01365 [Catharanthus roseus]
MISGQMLEGKDEFAIQHCSKYSRIPQSSSEESENSGWRSPCGVGRIDLKCRALAYYPAVLSGGQRIRRKEGKRKKKKEGRGYGRREKEEEEIWEVMMVGEARGGRRKKRGRVVVVDVYTGEEEEERRMESNKYV